MRLEKFENLFLLQKQEEEVDNKLNNVISNIKEKLLDYLKEKIEKRDFNILYMYFRFDEDEEIEYYTITFQFNNFKLKANKDNNMLLFYKDVRIIPYETICEPEYDPKIDEAITDLIYEVHQRYGIKEFEFDGCVNKIFNKYKNIKNKVETLEELYEKFDLK